MRDEREKNTVPAVNKALELVRVLASPGADNTTAELASRLAISRTTCYRILRSLVARDWIRMVDGGRYEISLGLFPLLRPLRRYEQLADAVQPALETLAQATRLMAKVSVRQGDYAVALARCESPMATSVAVRLGAAFHLAFGSSGAVLLGDLPGDELASVLKRAPAECWAHQTRAEVIRRLEILKAKRYCWDFGTFRPTCHAVSAAVRGPQRLLLAVVTVLGFPHEITRDRIPALSPALLKAARQMERALARLPAMETPGREESAL